MMVSKMPSGHTFTHSPHLSHLLLFKVIAPPKISIAFLGQTFKQGASLGGHSIQNNERLSAISATYTIYVKFFSHVFFPIYSSRANLALAALVTKCTKPRPEVLPTSYSPASFARYFS